MKKLLITTFLLLSTNVFASSPPFNTKWVNGTSQCPYHFQNKTACANWFIAQGMWDSPAYHECCDNLK